MLLRDKAVAGEGAGGREEGGLKQAVMAN